MPQYSIEDRGHCACWYDATRSAAAVQRRFRGHFGRHAAVPGHKAIKKWHKKFFTTGTILRDERTGRRTVREGEVAAAVLQAFQDDVHISVRRAANAFEISPSSVLRILHDQKFHPYKLRTLHQLSEEDRADRLAFCRDELERIEERPEHLPNLFFSDEAHFHLHGGVNHHNFRYWSEENPQWHTEEPLH